MGTTLEEKIDFKVCKQISLQPEKDRQAKVKCYFVFHLVGAYH